jgi:hypothetical protein
VADRKVLAECERLDSPLAVFDEICTRTLQEVAEALRV